jgi:hypothetical protein
MGGYGSAISSLGSMAQSNQQMGAAGVGSLGAGLAGLIFGNGPNPANTAMPYLNNISQVNQKYLNPYNQMGQGAMSNLSGVYGNILSNPGAFMNQIGSNFHQSPGFQFSMNQAMNAANNAQAAGGMAGTPQNTQTNMTLATQLGNQNYYNYMQNAMGLFGQGMQGEQGLAGMGLQSADAMATNESMADEEKAQLAYEGQAGQNQAKGQMYNNLFSGMGDLMSI